MAIAPMYDDYEGAFYQRLDGLHGSQLAQSNPFVDQPVFL